MTFDDPYYIVWYKCNNGIHDLFYGYKVKVNNNGVCVILGEGTDIADTPFE